MSLRNDMLIIGKMNWSPGYDSHNHPITPPKGQPMPQTVEYYEKLADGQTILVK